MNLSVKLSKRDSSVKATVIESDCASMHELKRHELRTEQQNKYRELQKGYMKMLVNKTT